MRPHWLPQEEFPFESRWMDLDGHRIHYVDEGSGPTLLFVHAGPVWSFVFRGLIERLRDEFRCIALDLPGSGLSEASDTYLPRLEAAAEVVESFVGALGLDELTLVLNDLGGPVALGGLASKHPELIQGVVVAEAFGWSLNAENPKVARMLRMIGSAPSIKLVVATNLMALGTSTRFGVGRHLTRSARAAFRGPYRDKRVRRNALAMLGDGARADSFLQEVDQTLHTSMKDKPLLTVFGERSPTTKEGFPQQWRARFPRARQTVVKGGHHFPQMDDPSGVAEAIRLWWHECVAPSVYESGRG